MERHTRITHIEQAACMDMVRAVGPAIQTRLGLDACYHHGALVLRAEHLPHPLHNRTVGPLCGSHPGRPPTEKVIAGLLERFAARDISRFFIQIPKDSSHDDARQALTNLGLKRYHRDWHELVRGRGPVPAAPPHIQIRPARAEDAHPMGELFANAFDLPSAAAPLYAALVTRPGWHAFIATIGNQTAGAGLLFIEGEAAFLAAGATHPDMRRRGVQGALMTARIHKALHNGCDLIMSNTGEAVRDQPNPSYHNMLRCGFAQTSATENWVLPLP